MDNVNTDISSIAGDLWDASIACDFEAFKERVRVAIAPALDLADRVPLLEEQNAALLAALKAIAEGLRMEDMSKVQAFEIAEAAIAAAEVKA